MVRKLVWLGGTIIGYDLWSDGFDYQGVLVFIIIIISVVRSPLLNIGLTNNFQYCF